MSSMLLCVCVGGWMNDCGHRGDKARYSESERMCHSLTGREQCLIRGTLYNLQ